MIERYLFIRLTPDYQNDASRNEVARRLCEALSPLPGVRSVTAGVPADDSTTRSWDISCVVRFAAIADIERYRIHPDHRAFVDDYLSPRTEVLKAWNFAVYTSDDKM